MLGRARGSIAHVDRYGRTEAHYAALDGDVARLRALAASDPSALARADRDGRTPLHFAAQELRLGAVRALIDAGVEVDPADRNGNTPLFDAVFRSTDDHAVVHELRRVGADPWKTNRHGQTPVELARLIANSNVADAFDDLPLVRP